MKELAKSGRDLLKAAHMCTARYVEPPWWYPQYLFRVPPCASVGTLRDGMRGQCRCGVSYSGSGSLRFVITFTAAISVFLFVTMKALALGRFPNDVLIWTICFTILGLVCFVRFRSLHSRWMFHLKEFHGIVKREHEPEALTNRLVKEFTAWRESVMGPLSTFGELRANLQVRLDKTAALKLRFKNQMNGADAERCARLKQGRRRAKAAYVRILESTERMDAHAAKLEAFFGECEAHIRNRVAPIIGDSVLFMELRNEEERAEALVSETDAAIAESLQTLIEGLDRLSSGLERHLTGAAKRLERVTGDAYTESLDDFDRVVGEAFNAIPPIAERLPEAVT